MSASNVLRFSCQCGAVRGKVANADPRHGDYVVCHCSDCQDLTRYLGQADRVLDAHGGSHLYQSRCASVTVDQGRERLAGLHMTEEGTLRWYAECCNTPLFNTYANGKIPYITTQLAACDGAGRGSLGTPLGHLFLADATGDVSGLRALRMNKLMRRFFVRMVKDVVSGDRRRAALFDARTLEPIAAPKRLTAAERAMGIAA